MYTEFTSALCDVNKLAYRGNEIHSRGFALLMCAQSSAGLELAQFGQQMHPCTEHQVFQSSCVCLYEHLQYYVVIGHRTSMYEGISALVERLKAEVC